MTKQTLGNISIILAILLGLGLFTLTVRGAAGELPWPGATNPAPLAQRNDLRERTSIAVAPGIDSNVSVAWASSDGIILTQQIGGSWTQSQTVALGVTGKAGWHPNIVYSGTDVLATWVQGEAPSLGTSPSAIRQQTLDQDQETLRTQTIITPIYGLALPDIAIASTGIHLVFAASQDGAPMEASKWNLYYMHRPLTDSTWTTPTAIITHTEVLTSQGSNQVRYPKLAVDSTGAELHIVWEQKQTEFVGGESIESRMIWYIHGTWADTEIAWDAPQRISPLEQNAILPNIAVDGEDQIHISWSEFIGPFTAPSAQYINYQRGAPDQGHAPYRLHERALQVNNRFPTNAETAISARDEHVCIAWYGFYGKAQEQGKEQIWMHCSPDSGLSWPSSINVARSSNFHSAYAQIDIDALGQAHLIWGQFLIEQDKVISEGLYYRTGTAELARIFLPVIMRER